MFKSKYAWYIIRFVLVYWLIQIVLGHTALSTLSSVDIDVNANNASNVKLYYRGGLDRTPYSEKHTSRTQPVIAGEQRISIKLDDKIVKWLRIDFGHEPVTIHLYKLILRSNFSKDFVLSSDELAGILIGGPDTIVRPAPSGVKIVGLSNDTYVILTPQPVYMKNIFIGFVLPAFIAVAFLLLWENFSFRSLPAISDITCKAPSSGGNIPQLDGLRGFAALLVLADHTGYPYFKGLGALGVWLFFALSGFLLTRPFIVHSERSISITYLGAYFLRRLKRIIPMFYVYITVCYLLRGMLERFIRHLFFIQGDSILWSIPQEIYFYILLPGIMLINHCLFRGKYLMIIFFLILLSWYLNCCLNINMVSIYGNGRKLPFWAGVFLTGVIFSYIYYGLKIHSIVTIHDSMISFLGFFFLTGILLSSNGVLQPLLGEQLNYTWDYFGWYGALMAFFLYLVIISNSTALAGFFSWYPLRAVGVVGFSFYLLHIRVLEMITFISSNFMNYRIEGLPLFIAAMIITYCFSAVTYSYIERPFLQSKG